VVTVTPTAENNATATLMAARETAIAVTTGTPPANRIIVGPTLETPVAKTTPSR
jgi:hypothetical protein